MKKNDNDFENKNKETYLMCRTCLMLDIDPACKINKTHYNLFVTESRQYQITLDCDDAVGHNSRMILIV